jgi:hypothetical protein
MLKRSDAPSAAVPGHPALHMALLTGTSGGDPIRSLTRRWTW